jgi:hypothetical protein
VTATDHRTPAGTPPAGAPGPAAATCVFAVRRSPDAGCLTGVPGHAGGGPLHLLELDGGLWAVAQDVPGADFTQEALRERLSDRAVLESCARAHHSVVTAAAADGPVVPLPLATLFTGPARARAALCERRPHLYAALGRVAGRAEWAVKVHVRQGRPAAVRQTAARPLGDPVAGGRGGLGEEGAGRAYLSRLRGRERERRARQDAGLGAARYVHEVAERFAVDSTLRRPHGSEITGRDRPQVLNAAYLVEDGRAADLVAAVRALDGAFSGADVEIEVSGPWVPYSFTGEVGT